MSIRLFPVIFLMLAANVFAATFVVTRSDDRNATCISGTDCSLREAVTAANNSSDDDTINFASGITTITLNNVEIAIASSGKLTINGCGADIFTIDGGPGQNRIFYTAGATVIFRSMTLTGGNAVGTMSLFNLQGGAIYSNGGNLTLDRVNVTGNTATSGGAAGGIFFFGGLGTATHRILNSTFSNNQTGTSCGAFYNSGSFITVVNSTFTGNSAKTGGAICNDGDLSLRNVTIYGNTGSLGGGGLYQGSFQTNLANTILAGNIGPADAPEILSNGTVTSLGNNLIGDSAGDSANTHTAVSFQPTDIRDTSPLLASLQLNGGQTPTMAFLAGSPAIDAGNNASATDPSSGNVLLSTDQRAFIRIAGPAVDIGAFESSSSVAPITVSGRVMLRGRGAARVVLTLLASDGGTMTALTNPFGYYRFKNTRAGQTYTLTAISKQGTYADQSIYVSADIGDLNFSEQ